MRNHVVRLLDLIPLAEDEAGYRSWADIHEEQTRMDGLFVVIMACVALIFIGAILLVRLS